MVDRKANHALTSILRIVFWNQEENRLRAGWRLVSQAALNILLILVLSLPFGLRFNQSLNTSHLSFDMIRALLRLVATSFSVWFAGRYFDRRRFSDFGLRIDRSWWTDFGFGLFLGALPSTVGFLMAYSLGWLSIASTFSSSVGELVFPLAILLPFVQLICVGIYEELFNRGYQLKNLAEGLKSKRISAPRAMLLAALLTSFLFGILHVLGGDISVVSIVFIMITGIVLSLGYLFTGRLAIPIGYHIAFNFFYSHVYGFPNGGRVAGTSFITFRLNVPTFRPMFGFGVYYFGLFEMFIISALILAWVKVRYGAIQLHEEIAVPNLMSMESVGDE
jgi:membrane protease YdiL (CAAX protease family)